MVAEGGRRLIWSGSMRASVKFPGPLDERKAVALLAALFVLCTAFVLAHPHSFAEPTVPDEGAYYLWATIYNNGSYAVPLAEWFGIQDALELCKNSTGVHFLVLSHEVTTRDSVGADNDLVVTVALEDGTRIPGATVVLHPQPQGTALTATTGADGTVAFLNLRRGGYGLEASIVRAPGSPGDPPLDLHAGGPFSVGAGAESYRTFLKVTSVVPSGASHIVALVAGDSFGSTITGADILVGRKGPTAPKPARVGATDGAGEYPLTLSATGNYIVVAQKAGRRGGVPIASIVEVDGQYYAVNRWAPGFSVLLGLFIMAGIAEGINLVLSALASVALYVLVRRMFGWRAAAIATAVGMTCGAALMAVWLAGMADYASMTFALVGIALSQEALAREHRILKPILALTAGLSLGFAVCIRYSTVTLVVVPFVMFAIALVRASPRRGRFRVPDAKAIKKLAPPFLALLLGLAVPAALLMDYNTTYFGSPLGSAYMYGGMITVEGEGNNTTAATSSGTFYENFNPVSAVGTLGVRMGWLLLVMPFILFVPLAIWAGRREHAILILAVFFLSNFVLYAFIPWVGVGGDATRAVEDMRYFLPAMPAAAAMASWVLVTQFTRAHARKLLVVVIVVLLLLTGFAGAQMGINLQYLRAQRGGAPGGGGGPQPPPTYQPVTVAALFSSPAVYNNTLVAVENATFWRWVAPDRFLMNQTGALPIAVVLDAYTPPALQLDDRLLVKGVFRWFDADHDGIADPPELVISVKGGTSDLIAIIG